MNNIPNLQRNLNYFSFIVVLYLILLIHCVNLVLNKESSFKCVLNALSQIEQINVFLFNRVNIEYQTQENQCDIK